MIPSDRVRESVLDSLSYIGWRTWLMALAICALGGCLLAYDYGDYRPADDGAGAAGSGGGSATGGQSCSVDEQPAEGCQQCLNAQCSTQLSACSDAPTCKPFALCVIECCEPECFNECDKLTTAPGKEVIGECVCNFCEAECNSVTPPCP